MSTAVAEFKPSEKLLKTRNIGISAHIDSGKTTLTERILFYTNRIHAIHEVRGKDGVGAKMDSMDLERERGITIQSAATYCQWKNHTINIIDTPGHVDFTVEVERSLRVLDSAILVLCGVAGVQSQSITVDRQMRRYNVPRVAFINKLDRTGANPFRVIEQLKEKLKHNAVPVQIPIGLENDLKGVVDLVTMKAYFFEGKDGMDIQEKEIPDDLKELAQKKHEELLDAASMFSDELTEALLEGTPTEEMIKKAIRTGTIELKMTPVFMGSAFKNKGVQKLLDGVLDYLASPVDVKNKALDQNNNEEMIVLESNFEKPLVCLAFKLEDGRYGQLTYVRVYQGKLAKGMTIYNMSNNKKHNVGRLCRMHSDEMEDIDSAEAGDIIALFGIDCASGDTFTDGKLKVSMESMFVPAPVISLTIEAKESKHLNNLAKALNRFTKEDPTFQTHVDQESGQTIIKGMGELHLEVYIERMKREYGVELITGAPQVAYRETITSKADFDYTHKKQTGGQGQFGRVAGYMEPIPLEETLDYDFVNKVVGGAIPREYIQSVDKGFKSCLERGSLIGFPIIGVRCVINDGAYHDVDSSDMAFQIAGRYAFRQGFNKANPQILEPIMKVEVDGPSEFQGAILGSLNQRRGMILNTTEEDAYCKTEAEVPLADMFGYSTVLRSSTQGKAEFSMEFSRYAPVPRNVAEELMKKYKVNNKDED
ncbi:MULTISPECIES: elongation factor G [Leptospira]|uniref:Elongation factor G n=2 Tax=Leptospira kirschneri TaxID=29507 RepID=A0A1T1DYC5_9LEPT|nr:MULTISPECIES: elongation factor G [Leptospira]EMO75538.1 translation elongation factor G [Leptospira kirschneri str. 200801925]EJO69300.1 translation elongation factor G [Leptospira kirschneri serovar Grippotyphosa str. RM52]EKO49926.1 translation elongation factor G [Leptospira kirschneri str. 200802841]EKP06368.1 translation elongation factor G [Leptospira kirschneri str. 2008720114]EKQ85159.1 translation elongation factor G [Leptospira kirschneri serovar Grippotyphosa str. Moskva]